MRANALIILLVLVIAVAVLAQQNNQYVVSPPAVWQQLHDGGWRIGTRPVYSDDSSRVLFDKAGNVPFNEVELDILTSYLDVVIVGSDTVKVWKAANGFSEPEAP